MVDPSRYRLRAGDASRIESGFIVGEGAMIRPTQYPYENTRIAALISLFKYNTFGNDALHTLRTDGQSQEEPWDDALSGRAGISEAPTPCVTVWENGIAKRRLPQDIPGVRWMNGGRTMETTKAWTFIGERRLALGIDKPR